MKPAPAVDWDAITEEAVRLLSDYLRIDTVNPPGNETRAWRSNEAWVFDDTIEHEAWNDSDDLRVVLIFDLWAPALDLAERDAVAKLIAAAGVSFKGT